MAQLRFEVHRALPVLEASIDGPAVVDEVARLAVGGRSGTEVVQVTAPDLADVTGLGVRASDGGSIYRPPNEERYCSLAHLDVEEQILAAAKRALPRLVEDEQARAAVERTGLNVEQRDAVAMMLTATAATAVLVAPAGAGKSHTMAEFARLWTTRQAGARIIATGDTAQLGAVEAAGMFRLLTREVSAAELHEVRRFDAQWERRASIRLRNGDPVAIAAYDRHGRIRSADYL